MAESALVLTDKFTPFPVDRIIDNTVTDFDTFLQISDHLVLYGAAGYLWLKRELDELLKVGLSQFYVRQSDWSKVVTYEKVARLPLMEKNLAPHARIVSIEEVGSVLIECMHHCEITESCVARAKQLAESLVDCLKEDRTSIQALSGLGNYDRYTFLHSMRVAAFTTAIAIEMGLTDETMLREIALGGIFHDIGKKNVSATIINKAGALTDAEWREMRSHPEQGLTAVIESSLPHVPKEIIVHHHEKLDGSGYPHGINKSSLLLEVQIATLADIYDALTSTRSYQSKRSRYEALDFIRHNFIGVKIAKEPFQALISCLISKEKKSA